MREVVNHITIILITRACCVSCCFVLFAIIYQFFLFFVFLKTFSSVDRNKKVNGRRNCQFEITLFVH